jgi:hypothetical protein
MIDDIDNAPEAIERELMADPIEVVKESKEVPIDGTVLPSDIINPSHLTIKTRPWLRSGWKSSDYNPRFFEQFGGNLTEDSKRDVYVVDSLAKHWASKLFADPSFARVEIPPRGVYDPAKTRQGARHEKTNYDTVSKGFSQDVLKNMESHNMPGKAVQIKPLYDPVGIPYHKDGPVLVLSDKEKPTELRNTRLLPRFQEGPGLYDWLFRTRIDSKLHDINPSYWESITKW